MCTSRRGRPEDLTRQTPLQNRYCLWYMRRTANEKSAAPAPAPANSGEATTYQSSIKQVQSFGTVEHFWRVYDHLVKPGALTTTTDYHIFKDGITPTWEDPSNSRGGKWIVRLRKVRARIAALVLLLPSFCRLALPASRANP